ncbi:ribonuclease HII [Mammaliicoccus sciuri]|uniref:ribonuclease HII n=1 Tax=Mammaliicoccus sciuri TaxID=1296 RepID=UPI001E61EA1A|nr:ribonuclease HII [Mammaliicoccus sciuri]MCD8762375.1 ribonuclease HII [Mammaliicoccus sciuri]
MKQKSIKEIVEEINQYLKIQEVEASPYNEDERKGVQNALSKRIKQLEKIEQLHLKYIQMNQYEKQVLDLNKDAVICGIDEVGRGPLAGPVVASAVILEQDHQYLGITDSKALSQAKRSYFEQEIYNRARAVGIGIATVEEIDELNIYEATKVAMQRAIDQLSIKPDHLLIDAMKLDNGIPQTSIIKGDLNSVSIAAASVIAKEYRDKLMSQYHIEYPGYDFDKNKGYGTKSHLEGLENYGFTPIHRKTFEPIKSKVKY